MISMQMIRRACLATFVMFTLAACSVTEYKGEIDAFTKAARQAENIFVELQKEQVTAHARITARNLIAQGESYRLSVVPPPDSLVDEPKCEMGLPQYCGAFLEDKSGKNIDLYPDALGAVNGAKLMKAYRVYGERLVALTNAKDAETVENAAAGVTSAIGGIANTLSTAGGPALVAGVSTVIGTLEGAVRWAARSYVEQKRYAALRSAVTTANPYFGVDDARSAVNRQIEEFLKNKLLEVESRLVNLKARFDVTVAVAQRAGIAANATEDEDEALAHAAVQSAKWFEADDMVTEIAELSLQARAIAADMSADQEKGVLAKLAKAHKKLKDALEDKGTNTKQALDAIAGFSDAASGLGDLVNP